METLKVHTKNKAQADAIKAVLKAMEIPFESETESTYNPEFVAKIKASEEEEKYGKTRAIKTDDLWK
tara:strand:- start:400 stop:600 length:201 start_codon:yes stop_codon:yes gene_type:complete